MRLRDSFSAPETRRRYVRRLFATIADRYDFITRMLSFGLDQRWKRRLLGMAAVRPGMRVLDLACGTGDLSLGASHAGARVVGLDITPRMVMLARQKPRADRVRWVVGDMGQLPTPTGAFDLVTTGYGLRNVPDLPVALAEIARTLGPGGRLLSLDFNRPESPVVRAVYLAYLTIVGSVLGIALHGDPDTYRYIPASIRRYPGAKGVAELLRAAGFTRVEVHPVLGGLMAIHEASR